MSKKLISVFVLASVVVTLVLVIFWRGGSTENANSSLGAVALPPVDGVASKSSETIKSEKSSTNRLTSNDASRPQIGVAKPNTMDTASKVLISFKQGAQLTALYNELIKSSDPSSLFLASDIIPYCALIQRFNESTYKARQPNKQEIAVQTLKAIKQSCLGVDMSNANVERSVDMRKSAIASGDPLATVANLVPYISDAAPGDAFTITSTLLKRYPENPLIVEAALSNLHAFGLRIGANDEQLNRATRAQTDAALMLASCEQTSSCDLQSSRYLQDNCIVGGRCALTMQDYIHDFVLPAAEFTSLPAFTARLSELIAQQRWDLLGYTDANRPSQTKPSIITAPTSPPSTNKPKVS
jgi:hypothetical protein